MSFSVLMSIYIKEKSKFFDLAMRSIWDLQSTKPSEIILIQDGPLTEELYASIDLWREKLNGVLKIVAIKKNLGLGDALNIGLSHCSNELVARMDSDDIAMPDRFQKQLQIFSENNIDVCGTWVSEFDENESVITSYRKVPQYHSGIVLFSKKQNPLNHPSVMYKKSFVLAAGSYKKMMWFEDYYLWGRMIINGAVFYNIQEPLVNMRAGYGQLERRRGVKYALSEVSLQKHFLSIKLINHYEFFRNVIIRFTARVSPQVVVKLIYKVLRHK